MLQRMKLQLLLQISKAESRTKARRLPLSSTRNWLNWWPRRPLLRLRLLRAAKRGEAEAMLKKLLAEGMSADEIIDKLK